MEKMKRFIDIHIPINHCNLRCHYCYVSDENLRDIQEPILKYDIDTCIKALSPERLGGICHFNLCGHGETLIPNYVIDLVEGLLKQGHYVFIVTNGTLTNRIKEFARIPKELLRHLGFKFSFHFLELKRLNLLERFFENIMYVRSIGCSISVELTPNDELIPYIPEIKKLMMTNLGALCHLTVPRDMKFSDFRMMTKMNPEDFINKWKEFDSKLFDLKCEYWGEKRKEFCYAGLWSGLLNLENGILIQCYGCTDRINIFKDINKKIKFSPVGNNCRMPHCFNGHSFLALGIIPELDFCTYSDVRNRICSDGSEWLTPEMKKFLGQKLSENNIKLNIFKKSYLNFKFKSKNFVFRVKRKLLKIFRR